MSPKFRREAGFSIIELMISIGLGLVILAALTSFFVSTSANRHELERSTRQIENGRYAIDTLRDDLVLAGFYADLAPGATPAWQTNAACPAAIANLGFSLAPSYSAPVPIFGYADGTGAPTACLPNIVAGTDVLVVRRFNSEPVPVATAQLGTPSDHPNNLQWYLQISECAADDIAIPFVVGVGSASFPLHKLDCAGIADLWRLREQVYYVRDYSTTVGDGIPTLVRRELHPTSDPPASGKDAMEELPLVEGIESFRVDYGVDNDNNGSADAWRRCDTTTPCTATDWSNVVAAKLFVLSRNIDTSRGWVDNKTYTMGLSGSVGPFADAFKRHVYSAQVNMPNRTGPREPQYKTAPP